MGHPGNDAPRSFPEKNNNRTNSRLNRRQGWRITKKTLIQNDSKEDRGDSILAPAKPRNSKNSQ
jgi:hypothetical protein